MAFILINASRTYNGDYCTVHMVCTWDYGSCRLEDLQELEELGLASRLESTIGKVLEQIRRSPQLERDLYAVCMCTCVYVQWRIQGGGGVLQFRGCNLPLSQR